MNDNQDSVTCPDKAIAMFTQLKNHLCPHCLVRFEECSECYVIYNDTIDQNLVDYATHLAKVKVSGDYIRFVPEIRSC